MDDIYVDEKGFAHDDEGNTWKVNRPSGYYRPNQVMPPVRQPAWRPSPPRPSPRANQAVVEALQKYLEKRPNSNFAQSLLQQAQQGRRLSEKQNAVMVRMLAEARLSDLEPLFKTASYTGNPDGKPIYPHEIEHGYEEPIAGGSDVMRRLQNQLLHEQGNTDQMRPVSPQMKASSDYENGVVQEFLNSNMVRLGTKGIAWWLPAHNFGIDMTVSGKLAVWTFTIVPELSPRKLYETPESILGEGIIISPHWKDTGKEYQATAPFAEKLLKAAQQRPTIEVTTAAELRWYEQTFHLDLPQAQQLKLTQKALRLAARRWGTKPMNTFVSIGQASRVASRYIRHLSGGGL
jgi:hypothetical protein